MIRAFGGCLGTSSNNSGVSTRESNAGFGLRPTFLQALVVWIKIGLLSFGGPAGQIALMHRELVEKRRWVSNGRFLHALNFCMLLPGPEAQQLAIYTGWLLHRVRGGVVAGLLFVIPGALLMALISVVYVLYGKLPLFEAIFYGLKPAVMAIVAAAVIRIGTKALRNRLLWVVAALSFSAIFFFDVPFPLIIFAAGLSGFAVQKLRPDGFESQDASVTQEGNGFISDAISKNIPAPTFASTCGTVAVWGGIWMLPVILCIALLGSQHVLSQEGLFFSKAAMVTFGGAYAVLPYVAQQAVETHGWLSAGQMMDGLALAETTPGPLILVLQFVGFLGGWTSPESASPIIMGLLAAALTSWVTFIPGFLFIFAGAPFMERTRGNPRLTAALSAITAAVVGVILNLAVWFGWHVVSPGPGVVDWIPVLASLLFFYALQRLRWDVLFVVAGGALLGLLLYSAGIG